MIVLDENIDEYQVHVLRSARLHVRQIGHDVGQLGMLDPDIFRLLQRLSRPTLFTRDLGLYSRHLCHPRYAVVVLAVRKSEVASFVRRILAHPRLSQARDRMGRVLIAAHEGIHAWTLHSTVEEKHFWLP